MDHSDDFQNSDSGFDSLAFPDWPQMGILFFIMIGSAIVGLLLITGLGMATGLDFQEILGSLDKDSPVKDRNFVRSSILINHLTMFVIPALVFAYIMFKDRWRQFLRLDRMPRMNNWVSGFFLLLVSFPLIQYSFYINREWIPIPEWAKMMEDNTAGLIEGMLASNSIFELLFNVLIIAVVPAIGEELIFRGLLQGKMTQSLKNPVVAIWLTALLFSAFHMQFEGFIPRLLLGALLGYLYYWTNNLWVPIIAHFLNNFLQVVAQFLFSKELSDLNLDDIETVPVWQALLSLGLVIAVGSYIIKYNKNKKLPAA